MAYLYLIRHGKTKGNLEKRYVGRTDEPLCKAGIREMNERRSILLRSFSEEGAVICLPGKIYVSPMLRCRQTAKLLFPDAKQEVVADFCEMDFGAFEYKNYEELSGDPRYQAFIDSGGAIDFPDAEPQQQFRQRVRTAFEQCLKANENFLANQTSDQSEEPLIFGVHGGTMMAIMEAYARPHRDYFDWQTEAARGYRCRILRGEQGFYLDHVTKI